MPLEGERLVIEPRYPGGEMLSKIGWKPEPEDDEYKDATIRNRFWSDSRRGEIVLFQIPGKPVDWGIAYGVNHFNYDLQTLMCSNAWGIEQEGAAVRTLATLVTHHQFKQYMLTGMFMESSKRSNVSYMFRRLKPTVAIKEVKGKMKILACLCMHPIAYYAGTWAGAMCPTDDVIAHLMLMRGDEHMYWKKSNQHPAYRAEAGL